jgi:cell wall-associated NlpC family hydrolase
LYVKTGRERNIPWNVLAGIGKIETNHGRSTHLPGVSSGENYAGAGGPMQFLSASWNAYGDDWDIYWKKKDPGTARNDKDGDGKKDRYNPADAILGATNHLRGSIGRMDSSIDLSPSDIRRAVHLYNPGNYTPQSNPYARDVLAAANRYGKSHKVGSANYASTGTCSAGISVGSGSFGQRIANAAAYWAKKDPGTPKPPSQNSKATPYSWGGGSLEGPSYGIAHGKFIYGFDCSGLARFAVHKASGGKIVMPRTTWPMYNSNKGVKIPRDRRDQLAPGDLVFFSGLDHMGIYYGEVNGVRWMVEAQKTGTDVMFSRFDGRGSYVGAFRVTPPTGMGNKSPSVFPA